MMNFEEHARVCARIKQSVENRADVFPGERAPDSRNINLGIKRDVIRWTLRDID